MARFVALLLLGPCLAVLGWLYWLYVRRRATNGVPARLDVSVLVAAVLVAIVSCGIAWQLTLGHGGPIWKQVATPLATYAGFNVVLLCGLLWHWRHGKRRHVREAAK